MKKIIVTEKAPKAIGPYSQAVAIGDLIFCSGQIPLDPATGEFVAGGVTEQAERVMKNVKGLLEGAGSGIEKAVKATIFAKNMSDFTAINEVFAKYFSVNPPARSFVEVAALPKGALVEIEVIAHK